MSDVVLATNLPEENVVKLEAANKEAKGQKLTNGIKTTLNSTFIVSYSQA